jgi:N-glycosidase YbiA
MEVLIRKVKEENGWLSCMSAYPVTYKGTTYRTCEALFQSLRFKDFPDIQKEIHEQTSPMAAKMKARKNREKLNRGAKWDEDPSDIPLMKECLLLKLEQHPELKDKLLATGAATIIEDCTTHDRESARFWGMVFKDGQWIGENVFGNLWMEIRDELTKSNKKLKEARND